MHLNLVLPIVSIIPRAREVVTLSIIARLSHKWSDKWFSFGWIFTFSHKCGSLAILLNSVETKLTLHKSGAGRQWKILSHRSSVRNSWDMTAALKQLNRFIYISIATMVHAVIGIKLFQGLIKLHKNIFQVFKPKCKKNTSFRG